MNWVDKELERLQDQCDRGEISHEEYRECERDIFLELEEQARENAERAYHDTLGY